LHTSAPVLRRRQGAARATVGCPDLIMRATVADRERLAPAGTWSVGPTLALQ